MKFYNVEQNQEEWLSLRTGKFTASTFSDLFAKRDSVTYRKAIINVAYERVTGESEESYSNKWMQRGHEREPFARELYESLTFTELENGGFYEYNDFVGASPDAKIKGLNGGCEFKCPSFPVYHEFLESGFKKIPSTYFWQVHGQLLCTGWDFIDYMPYSHPKLKTVPLRIERDERAIQMLLEQLNAAIEQVKLIISNIQI